jgi:hypothetical protein
MIKSLRKRHLQIWTVLAVLLPIGIALSWLIIPNPVPVKILNPVNAQLLPLIKYKRDNEQYCINIRTNKESSEWQLEWKNKLALTVPSAVIYQTTDNNTDITKAQLIGRIEARGDYVFELPNDSSGYKQLKLIVYDFIHQKVVDYINF